MQSGMPRPAIDVECATAIQALHRSDRVGSAVNECRCTPAWRSRPVTDPGWCRIQGVEHEFGAGARPSTGPQSAAGHVEGDGQIRNSAKVGTQSLPPW